MMSFSSNALATSKTFHQALEALILQSKVPQDRNHHTLNVKDRSYTPQDGGYHPVEIRIERINQKWTICYITEFAYIGGDYPELAIELDFNIEHNYFEQMFSTPTCLDTPSVRSFYTLWESNFLSYLEQGAFDDIRVSA
ncbi:DUF2787 family protein [Agarivorans sp. B2Z047]|nr:DUF2787 family protein [Agarivorans sp. B2Z047]